VDFELPYVYQILGQTTSTTMTDWEQETGATVISVLAVVFGKDIEHTLVLSEDIALVNFLSLVLENASFLNLGSSNAL